MKIWWRWVKLCLTCGLGIHAEFKDHLLPGKVIYSECPRCHAATYTRPGLPRDVKLRPPLWDVARGLYDRGIQP